MRIIEIAEQSNGAHRNQSSNMVTVPEGWAVIPDGMEVPDTFPFVGVTAESGVVTELTPGIVPPPEPEPEPEPTLDERLAVVEEEKADKTEVAAIWDEMSAAYTEGVNEA